MAIRDLIPTRRGGDVARRTESDPIVAFRRDLLNASDGKTFGMQLRRAIADAEARPRP